MRSPSRGLDSLLAEAENGLGVFGRTIDLPAGTRIVVVGLLMALVLVVRPSGLTGGREFSLGLSAAGRAGRSRMRVCVVGCGAVGSLFAANLATLDDVEVWAFDLFQAHVDAINADGLRLSGAGEVHARLQATSDAAALPPCDFGIVATKAMHADGADRRDGARVRRRRRGLGHERRRQRGDARPARRRA